MFWILEKNRAGIKNVERLGRGRSLHKDEAEGRFHERHQR